MNSGEILRMTEEKYILCYQRETHTAKDDRAIYVSFYQGQGDSNILIISTKLASYEIVISACMAQSVKMVLVSSIINC